MQPHYTNWQNASTVCTPKVTKEKNLFGGSGGGQTCQCKFSLGARAMMAGQRKKKKMQRSANVVWCLWWACVCVYGTARCWFYAKLKHIIFIFLLEVLILPLPYGMFCFLTLSSTQTNRCSWNRCSCSSGDFLLVVFLFLLAKRVGKCVKSGIRYS